MGRIALSTGLAGVSGTVGDLVFEQRPGGPVVKARSTSRPARTPGQRENERRLVWVSAAWHVLDADSFAAWGAFAESCAVRNPATGAWVVPRAYNLFCKYAGKVRQIDPAASLEGFRPPARPFGGDGVEVSVTPSPDGSFGRGGRGERSGLGEDAGTPSPTVPPGTHDDSSPEFEIPTQRLQGEPSLSFSSSAANAPGVVTELLVQPLANARRRVYADRYVSKGFVVFAGAESVEVPLPVGAYACAYRFVRRDTGQETAIFALGVVEVTA